MKINRENIDNVNATIRVLIEKNDYEKNVADKLREYRHQVALPGFRPGKVPAGIIQKRFGKAILAEEVNQLLSQNLTNYLRDEKINLIGDPLPNTELQPTIDFEKDQEFEFVFDVAISPEVVLELDDSQSIDYYKITVDDKMVEENVEQIRSQYGKNVDTNEVTKDAYIRADFVELDADGNEVEEGIRAENVLLAIDHVKDEETLNLLVGKNIDEALVFNPATSMENRHEVGHMLNISNEAAETLESNFRCTVKSIQVFEKAEVNEELFRSLFGEDTDIATEEQFIEKIKENISASLENSSKQRFEVDAKKALISSMPLELPETFLKRWLKETNKELTEEKIEEEFDDFREDLRWQLIKNAIINKNEIQVSEEETLDMAKSVALSQYQQYGIYQVADEHLESFANRILEKEEDRERIVRRIFEVKVFDLVREKVSLKENMVTADEFKALYN
jgi:trigger factor